MKKFFIGVLVLNLLIEAFAAFTLISAPENMFPADQAAAAMWAKIYGFGALAIASSIFWIWPNRSDYKAVSSVLGILLTFHICIFVALVTSEGQQAGTVIHAVLTVLFATLYALRSKWCTK